MNLLFSTALAEETAAPQGYDFLGNLFKKVAEFSTATWLTLVALLLMGVLLIVLGRRGARFTTQTLAFAALSIALSFLLNAIRLYRMPEGGSITPAGMLPLMLFSYACGVAPGMLAGMAFGLLDFLQGGYMLTPVQFALDYIIAYAMCGLTGLLRHRDTTDHRLPLGLGVALACVARFACSVLSGVVFFAEYAEGTGRTPLVYSIFYNGAYMLPNMVICIVLGVLIVNRVLRVIKPRP